MMIRRVYPRLDTKQCLMTGVLMNRFAREVRVSSSHMSNRFQRMHEAPPLFSSPQTRSVHTSPVLMKTNDEPELYITQPTHHTLPDEQKFKIDASFVKGYSHKSSPFGFNGLGEVVYKRTYSRVKSGSQESEEWFETVERVVNGCFNMQKTWLVNHHLGWNEKEMQEIAQDMYDRIFHMKFLPPGRGLWAMGSPITEERGLFAALNNCAFVSTGSMRDDPAKPFLFLMDMAMLGVGVGFDTKGVGSVTIRGTRAPSSGSDLIYVIPDSREGWVQSVKVLIDSYFTENYGEVKFDYGLVRPAGLPIKGFGGISSGPGCLMQLHDDVRNILSSLVGKEISVRAIVDLMNCIGKCVVSGNVRRTAEIAFGDYDSEEFMDLKDYQKNPYRADFGWTSNNSLFAQLGMDYTESTRRVRSNGEPGFAWLQNMRAYSRMNGSEDWKDIKAAGGNPCLEQTLESYELCCLVETFPHKHENLEDYKKTLRMAYLYAKTVTLGKTHWPETNQVLLKNRRIGCSMSGIAQFLTRHGIEELRTYCSEGYQAIQQYDEEFSNFFSIPRSIKTTSIKPSGTVSLLAGATPGMHYPLARFYKRRLRMSNQSDLLPYLREAGYYFEESAYDSSSVVVEFPVDVGEGIRTQDEISMWEQLSLAAFLQKYWADNQVSCTITFDPVTEGPQITHALNYFQYQLKGVSFLPKDNQTYAQMPYENITEQEYNDMVSRIKPLNIKEHKGDEPVAEKYCDGAACEI